MKTVIFCGGKGTRIKGISDVEVPKPLVKVAGKPILEHVMDVYSSQGHSEFILCLGHLGWMIKDHFVNARLHSSNLEIDMSSGEVSIFADSPFKPWKITLIDTGPETMTAGRLQRVLPYIKDQSFFLTYGDGISDVNLAELEKVHKSGDFSCTLSGVSQPGRFGIIKANDNVALSMMEKPVDSDSMINGGYMICNTEKMKSIVSGAVDTVMFEDGPLREMAASGELGVYRHSGLWQCMDTPRDWEYLDNLLTSRSGEH